MKKILISLVALFAVVIAVVAFVLMRNPDRYASVTCWHGACEPSSSCTCTRNWAGALCDTHSGCMLSTGSENWDPTTYCKTGLDYASYDTTVANPDYSWMCARLPPNNTMMAP